MKRKIFRPIIILRACIVVSLVGLFISVYFYYITKLSYETARNTYSIISNQYASSDYAREDNIDFSSLTKINEAVVGWIRSDDSVINYAILQGSDNDYYLTHMIDNSYNKAGSIFMDYTNNADFSDENTIIYGHNMKDGSMFAYLLNYKDQAFYNQHPSMNLYTLNGVFQIDIFAGIIVSGDENYLSTNFINTEEKINYLTNIKENSTFVSEIEPTKNSRLITLSTCSYDFEDARYVLFGIINIIE